MARVPLKKRWSPSPAVRRGRRVCWAVLLVLLAIGALTFFRRSKVCSPFRSPNGHVLIGHAVHLLQHPVDMHQTETLLASCQGGASGITAIVRDGNSSVSSGMGGVAPATAFDPASTINLEALDGTGGRQGPRTWGGNEPSRDNAFADPKDYLEPEDYMQYQQWLAWSDKPRGMDYVRPSRTHFSLGKTRAWKGDITRPGSMKEMLEVRRQLDICCEEFHDMCFTNPRTWKGDIARPDAMKEVRRRLDMCYRGCSRDVFHKDARLEERHRVGGRDEGDARSQDAAGHVLLRLHHSCFTKTRA